MALRIKAQLRSQMRSESVCPFREQPAFPFGQSGTADELMKFYGLDADGVAASVKAYLA